MPATTLDVAGKVINQAGIAKGSLTVDLFEAADFESGAARTATTTTDSDGLWAFTAQDITKTWLVVVNDGTKKFIIDGRNSQQLTSLDLITELHVDTVYEHTSGSGVTIDSVLLKDGGATLTGALISGTGEGGTTAATGNTLRAPNVTTGGAGNVAGADLIVAAGKGTGTGNVGTFIIQLAVVAASGDNLQTVATRLTFDMVASTTQLTMQAAQALVIQSGSDVTIRSTSNDVILTASSQVLINVGANTSDAFHVRDGSVNYYAIRTSTATLSVTIHSIDTANVATPTPGSGSQLNLLGLLSFSAAFDGTTTVNDMQGVMLDLGVVTITNDETQTITQVSTLYAAVPVAADQVTITRALSADFAGAVRFEGSIFAEGSPTEGTAGEQLESAGAGAVVIWATASSKREYKNVGSPIVNGAAALDAILATTIYNFKYPRPVYREVEEVLVDEVRGKRVETRRMVKELIGERKLSTGDYDTDYVGFMAEDAPWAVHHNGNMLNPINTIGYAYLAIQELERRIRVLEARGG